jgi:hypothetical protein
MSTPETSKYADECELLCVELQARGVALIVVGGNRGDGFGFATIDAALAAHLPKMLRIMATEVERQGPVKPTPAKFQRRKGKA